MNDTATRTTWDIVREMEDPLLEVHLCVGAFSKLLGHVEERHAKQVMYSIDTDLSEAAIKLRQLFEELHEVTKPKHLADADA